MRYSQDFLWVNSWKLLRIILVMSPFLFGWLWLLMCVFLFFFSAVGMCVFVSCKKSRRVFRDTFLRLSTEVTESVSSERSRDGGHSWELKLPRWKRDLREELGNLANATPLINKFEKTSCRNVLGTERTVVTVKKHEEERCDFFKNDFYDPILVREFEVVDAGVTRWCAIGRKGVPQRTEQKTLVGTCTARVLRTPKQF